MATVKKHISKSGKVTYYIRTYDGYDSKGKQVEHSMTWKPPEGMTAKQIERELQKQVVKFEESVTSGSCFDNNTRFGEYAVSWLESNRPPQLAPKTYERYKAMLKAINTAIGEIKLAKLQSRHLQMFYNNLRENGVKRTGAYAVSDKIGGIIRQKRLSQGKFASLCGVSPSTIRAVCKPDGHISIESARKIAAGLQLPVDKLFELHQDTGGLSDKTILHHHKLISSILAQATRDRLIPFNIADKNYMKAPRQERKEAAFLDDEQARHVLELLEEEPIKWKTIMYLFMFSGIRRGELLGLEWKDVDFENKVIHICRTSQYVDHMGIITKSPKNDTSFRTIKLSETMFDQLRSYRQHWQQQRQYLEEIWQDTILITLADGSQQLVPNDRLFIKDDSTPMNPDSVTDWVRKFVKRNGLPHFTPHSLRHTHATLLIAEGVSIPTVSRRLGHSSIATTSKIYVHAIQSADEIASCTIEEKLLPHKDKKP
ncbi:MAG: tyrosine-type recombinase/integrase [Ruminococcus sp.]|nr:tyrosine-type recombinase/integrase [Ruminococcus sp.]MBR2284685.1 tyrosine-type recombinase/integrase [Ruminococcus sp.]